mgnify:CR=1 FL=1
MQKERSSRVTVFSRKSRFPGSTSSGGAPSRSRSSWSRSLPCSSTANRKESGSLDLLQDRNDVHLVVAVLFHAVLDVAAYLLHGFDVPEAAGRLVDQHGHLPAPKTHAERLILLLVRDGAEVLLFQLPFHIGTTPDRILEHGQQGE